MEAHANWMDLPEQPYVPEDNGPEFERIKAEREKLTVMKKHINQLNLKIAATLRMPNNEKFMKDKEAQIEALGEFAKEFKEDSEDRIELDRIYEQAKINLTAESHVDFQDLTKKTTHRIFRVQKTMLADMKAAKKEYLANKKE